MDLLACPICKHFPLELVVFEEREVLEPVRPPKKTCELYCGYKRSRRVSGMPCRECFRVEIVEGILICPNCNRWYPIRDEIPHMLPDELRSKEEDLAFLRKHKDRVPREVLESGRPFRLGV